MKKQRVQLLVLAIVLIALCAALLGVRQYNQAQAEKPEEEEGEVVLAVEADDIIRFSYDYEGVTYTFEKEGDTWYYAEDHDLTLRQYYTASLVTGVAPLVATQIIENVTDMGQYGLTEPQRTISYETATGSYILYVGDKNTVTSGYYVCLPSESAVYVVDSADISRFNVTLDNLVDDTEEEENAENASAEAPSAEDVSAEESSADGETEASAGGASADGETEASEDGAAAEGNAPSADLS